MSEPRVTPEFIAALAQIDNDLNDYVRTLTHAEALSCIDHLGKLLYRSATYGPMYGTTDRAFRQRVPMVASALTLLAARAARTRPVRPGGRAAYNHDDCSAFHHLADLLQKLEDRLTVTLDGAGVKRL